MTPHNDPPCCIRLMEDRDWPGMWRIMGPVFRAGETYPYSPDISEAEASAAWVEEASAVFVAVEEDGSVVGTYYIKPNKPALGAHVCNCGYIVAEAARGRGVASAMCLHSQQEAIAQGFLAMQYNLVVSTNEQAFRLWKKHGFQVVGALPKAFRHKRYGLVDAYVMYKLLDTST